MEVQWTDRNIWIAMATIVFAPTYWITMARWEYKRRGLSNIIGSRHTACCLLAATIFLFGLFRDMRFGMAVDSQSRWYVLQQNWILWTVFSIYRFGMAVDSQPRWYVLQQNWILWTGYLCISIGTTFVLTSYYTLGFYGTFLGDYFGILMDKKVAGFPFSVIDNPMYWGSSLSFLGVSLVKASQSGMVLTCLVVICYKIALAFEGPFTAHIYAERERRKMA